MTQGLPVSRIVDVQVSLTALLAQAPAINTLLVLGTSSVIDVVERMRSYETLAQVAADFGTSAPEYLAAQAWFSQSPQPENLLIGRWANAATPGHLVGGGVAAADLLPSAWAGISDGSFVITINGGQATSGTNTGAALSSSEQLLSNWNIISNGSFTVSLNGTPHNVTGLDFTGAFFLDDVAATITTALGALVTGTTCIWNGITGKFTITSGTTGASSTVSYLTTEGTGTDISGMLKMRSGQATLVNGVASGGATNITGLNFSSPPVTNLNAVAAVIQTALNAAVAGTTCVYNSVYNNFIITSPTTGPSSSISFLSTYIGGTDISGMLSGRSTSSGAYQANGIAAESALTAVTLFDSEFASQWYGLVILGASDNDHEQVAAYIEGANPPHYYGITTQEAGVLVPNDTGDIAYILKALGYNKTAVQYSSTSLYAICSYLARILTTAWLGQNTTIDLMFKQEPGILPETLNSTQADAAKAKNCNVYVTYNNGTQFIEYGTSASGQFTDTVIGADWLAGEVQTEVFNALYGAATKVPQTDAGMGVLIAAASAACEEGVNNGYLAPGQWNSAGFGTLTQGQNLPNGFYVWAPPMATQSEAVRQTRAAPVMQIAAKNAGAIQSSEILLNVNQ